MIVKGLITLSRKAQAEVFKTMLLIGNWSLQHRGVDIHQRHGHGGVLQNFSGICRTMILIG